MADEARLREETMDKGGTQRKISEEHSLDLQEEINTIKIEIERLSHSAAGPDSSLVYREEREEDDEKKLERELAELKQDFDKKKGEISDLVIKINQLN